MDRTQAVGHVVTNGKRLFRNADLASGIDGTDVDAADDNAFQEELMGVIEGLGLAGNAADLTLLRKALARAAGLNHTVVNANLGLTPDQAGLVVVQVTKPTFINLPKADAAGGRPIEFQFVRYDETPHAVSISCLPGDSVEGVGNSLALPTTGRIVLRSNGVNVWWIVAERARVPNGIIESFDDPALWFPPLGLRRVKFRMWGAAGKAGGSINPNSAGAGGGGGAYVEGFIDVTFGTPLSLNVGKGGNAVLAGATGEDGQPSSIAGVATAGGGRGGAGGDGRIATSSGEGGVGTVVAGVNAFTYPGMGGATGYVTGDGGLLSGGGGSAFCSAAPGGAASSAVVPQNGTGGTLPGAGGAGGVAGGGGGKGADGSIKLEY